MSLKKPQPDALAAPQNDVRASCAICGADCSAMRINHVTLCDGHFDKWLEMPRDRSIGGQVAMAQFIDSTKSEAA